MTDAINSSISDDRKQCSITQDDKYCTASYKTTAYVSLEEDNWVGRSSDLSCQTTDISISQTHSTISGSMISFVPTKTGGILSPIGYGVSNIERRGMSWIVHYSHLHILVRTKTNTWWDPGAIYTEYRSVREVDDINKDNPLGWGFFKTYNPALFSPPLGCETVKLGSSVYPNVDSYITHDTGGSFGSLYATKRGDVEGDWSSPTWIMNNNAYTHGTFCDSEGRRCDAGVGDWGKIHINPKNRGWIVYLEYKPEADSGVEFVVDRDDDCHVIFKRYPEGDIKHILHDGYTMYNAKTVCAGPSTPYILVDPRNPGDLWAASTQTSYLYKHYRKDGDDFSGEWEDDWSDCRVGWPLSPPSYVSVVFNPFVWCIDEVGRLYAPFFIRKTDWTYDLHTYYLDTDNVWKVTDILQPLLKGLSDWSSQDLGRAYSYSSYWPRRNRPYSGLAFMYSAGSNWFVCGAPPGDYDQEAPGANPPVPYQWENPIGNGDA